MVQLKFFLRGEGGSCSFYESGGRKMLGYWTSREWEDLVGEKSHWEEFSIQY